MTYERSDNKVFKDNSRIKLTLTTSKHFTLNFISRFSLPEISVQWHPGPSGKAATPDLKRQVVEGPRPMSRRLWLVVGRNGHQKRRGSVPCSRNRVSARHRYRHSRVRLEGK